MLFDERRRNQFKGGNHAFYFASLTPEMLLRSLSEDKSMHMEIKVWSSTEKSDLEMKSVNLKILDKEEL